MEKLFIRKVSSNFLFFLTVFNRNCSVIRFLLSLKKLTLVVSIQVLLTSETHCNKMGPNKSNEARSREEAGGRKKGTSHTDPL